MTHDQFLQWIEEEIREAGYDPFDEYYQGRLDAFTEVKEKFEKLLPLQPN